MLVKDQDKGKTHGINKSSKKKKNQENKYFIIMIMQNKQHLTPQQNKIQKVNEQVMQ